MTGRSRPGVGFRAARNVPAETARLPTIPVRVRGRHSGGERGLSPGERVMPVTLGWDDVALRLALSVFAGGMFGLDRSILRKPAVLQTAVLFCLAAAGSRILANPLLPRTCRAPES